MGDGHDKETDCIGQSRRRWSRGMAGYWSVMGLPYRYMLEKGLKDYLPALLAAGGVDRFAEMARWRIAEVMSDLAPNFALDDLAEEARIQGVLAEALHEGWLERSGEGTRTELVVAESYRLRGRRALFGMEAGDAEQIYEAGRILANRLSTSSKKWRSFESDSTRWSASPGNRRHVAAGR